MANIFQIKTPSVEGNKYFNIPRVRKHLHKYKWVNAQTMKCLTCGKTIPK